MFNFITEMKILDFTIQTLNIMCPFQLRPVSHIHLYDIYNCRNVCEINKLINYCVFSVTHFRGSNPGYSFGIFLDLP